MTAIALKNATASHLLEETLAWLRHMRAALTLPNIRRPSRHADIANQVDRGISRIRTTGIDPRI